MEHGAVLCGIRETHTENATLNFGDRDESVVDSGNTNTQTVVVHTESKTDEFSRVDATWELDATHKVQLTTSENEDSFPADVSTPDLFEAYLESWRSRVGWMFHDRDEYETFMKLPISTEDRLKLLKKLTLAHKGAKRTNTFR